MSTVKISIGYPHLLCNISQYPNSSHPPSPLENLSCTKRLDAVEVHKAKWEKYIQPLGQGWAAPRLSGKEFTCNAGDTGSIPGPGRSPEEGNGNPAQYSCLGNPMGRGSWWATVLGVSKELDRTEWVNNKIKQDKAKVNGRNRNGLKSSYR